MFYMFWEGIGRINNHPGLLPVVQKATIFQPTRSLFIELEAFMPNLDLILETKWSSESVDIV